MTKRVFCAAAAILAFASALAQNAEPFLQKVRAALGYSRLRDAMGGTKALDATGRAMYMGTKGTYELTLTQSGQFFEGIKSELGQTVGFDGKTGWAVDYAGTPRVLELEDLETLQAVMWLYGGLWLSSNSPFAITFVEDKGGVTKLILKLRKGIFRGTLFVDDKTLQPRRLVHKSSAGDEVWEFSGYQKTNGFLLARKVTDTNGGVTNTIQIDSVKFAEASPSRFTSAIKAPSDATFDPKITPEVEVKRAFTGYILVRPLVDGKDVGWFILDTGAGGMAIDSAVANDLNLSKLGVVPVVGVGGVVKSSFRKARSLTLGPMTFAGPTFIDIDLSSFSGFFGVKLAGIVGYDLIARAVIELDIAGKRMTVNDPATYKLTPGSWQELYLDGKLPVVKAKFEGGRQGLFRLDTGAGNMLVFHYPAVQKLKLLDGRKVTSAKLGGVGGFMDAKSGTIAYFDLAGYRFDKPSVQFSMSNLGPFSDEYTTGNIGQGLLAPFTIVFDYPHKRIAFLQKG